MKKLLKVALISVSLIGLSGCLEKTVATPVADSGVKKASVKIKTGADGLSVEQRNVKERIKRDNDIGSYKHLYVISSFSGDVLIYSTVKGKVTSSSKRLSPTTVAAADGQYVGKALRGMRVSINGETHRTAEVLQDDGTFGSSVPYVYWFDVRGVYHQHYITGGQIFHVTDAPMAVGKIILNMETAIIEAGK